MWTVLGWIFFILFFSLVLIALVPVGVLLQYKDGVGEIHFTLWKKSFVLYPVVEKKKKPVKKPFQTEKTDQKAKKKSKPVKKEKSAVAKSGVQEEKNKLNEKPAVVKEAESTAGAGSFEDETIRLKTKKPVKEKNLGLEEQIATAKGFIPVVLLLFQRLGQYKKIDRLELDLLVGSPDPVEATMLYGKAHGLLGTIWLPLDHALNIQKGRAGVRLSFEEAQINLNALLAVSMTIGQICYLIAYVGLRAYKIWKTGGEKDG